MYFKLLCNMHFQAKSSDKRNLLNQEEKTLKSSGIESPVSTESGTGGL